MSLRTQPSVAVAATATVGGMAPVAADSSMSAKTADVVHLEKLDMKALSPTYRTASHDTPKAVARRTGVSPTAIAQANELTGPLRAGQCLRISPIPEVPKASLPAEPSSSLSHTIQQGDTLSGTAHQHGTTVAVIVQANGIADPARIYAGKTLTVPGAAMEASVTPQNPVPKIFLHYTYPGSTSSAANVNKFALEGAAVPSRTQMQEVVRSATMQTGVDSKPVFAHVYVESGFDIRPVSPVNAIGIMQVIPSSREWASRLVGRCSSLLDLHDNAVAGVAITHHLQSNADSVDQGVAGYYQGLNGMRKNGMKPDTAIHINRVKTVQVRF